MKQMRQTELGRVESVLLALENKRPDVVAHSRRVAAYSVRLASQYGFDAATIETIRMGALLHDVGKLLVPSRILDKPRRPNAREWRDLKIHPELGMEIAHRCGFDDDVCSIVLSHHERYDGSGYPDGVGREYIHFTVRIVSVMDSFDALTSSRDYRNCMGIDAARTLIARGSGSQFCPWVVSGLLGLPPQILNLGSAHAGRDRQQAEGDAVMPLEQIAQPWHATSAAALCAC
ncbi:MAG: HD domain-containing protein [Acidobacteria bacterium]|nr:HD domain-containing protein [Acidobacteriota bacterium]